MERNLVVFMGYDINHAVLAYHFVFRDNTQ